MQKPSRIIYSTVSKFITDSEEYDMSGVYIVKCQPSLGYVYVGHSVNVRTRLLQHMGAQWGLQQMGDLLGQFLKWHMIDSIGWGFDILIPPDDDDESEWLKRAETLLIHELRPLLNVVGRFD